MNLLKQKNRVNKNKFEKESNKKIGILGLGATGISVYKTLINIANSIICYDDSLQNRENFSAEYGSQDLCSIENEKWTTLDAIVISPGIPHSHRIFKIASINKIAITSDIELFTEENSESEFIFITGTNGKSTVTALVGHILKEEGLDYHIGGNIGTPVMLLPYGKKGYILELSSFQIELLNKVTSKISVITNITPDHLDRHGTVENYTRIKEKIFTTNAFKIIGINSVISKNLYKKFQKNHNSKIVGVSTCKKIANGIFCNNKYLEDHFFYQKKYLLPDLKQLQGVHNKENIAISYAVCAYLAVPSLSIIKAIESFKGLSHRMEYVGHYKNIKFYNDSKATNVSSALSSLSVFNNIIWFAGGKFKETSMQEFKSILQNIEKAYFFGESKNLFAKYIDSNLDHKIKYETCNNLEEAFHRAMEYSKITENKTLSFLLAPACASYDQFKNFEERGELFKKLALSVQN